MPIRTRAAAAAVHHMPKYEHGYCAKCRGEVDQKNFCWGCLNYIHEGCEKFSPEGQHKLEDHVHARPELLPTPLRRIA